MVSQRAGCQRCHRLLVAILLCRSDARRVADVWEDFFSRADQQKRLAMVYLANDIIQNGCAGLAELR